MQKPEHDRRRPSGRTTIADVARRAGVSNGAVSFALNGRPGVAEATRTRILQAAADLDWSPSLRAQSLSRSFSYSMGLVLGRSGESVSADPFFPAFIAGANAVLVERRRSLVFTVVADHDAELATYRRLAAESRIDGAFITDLRRSDPRPALLSELGLPAITLGRVGRDSDAASIGSVTVPDVVGVAAATTALLEAGHRRIAHITGPAEYLHVHRRAAAVRTTLAAAGTRPHAVVHTDFSAGAGARATTDLLTARLAPTAIVYANDAMAIAGISAARRLGRHVPADLSVTGFDDTELAALVDPPLTSVRTDVAGWGRVAAQALIDVVAGEPARHLTLPGAVLVERESIANVKS